jgi:hypothetical protein
MFMLGFGDFPTKQSNYLVWKTSFDEDGHAKNQVMAKIPKW